MPRNLRNFWIDMHVDGYKQDVERGPKSRSGGFSITINIASHGEPMKLLHIAGVPLQNGKNRVIIDLQRKLTAGEWTHASLLDQESPFATVVLEEDRNCKCLRGHDHT